MIARKRTPHDDDPFDIKKNGNMLDKEHKNDERGSETRPYETHEEWLAENNHYDPIDPGGIASTDHPWAILPMNDQWAAKWKGLRTILPSLKGRQKQVLETMLDGVLSPTEIAKKLGMDQRDVSDVMVAIRKKISSVIP